MTRGSAAPGVSLLTLSPSRNELVPWTDRKGRPSLIRGTVFALLTLPALNLLYRWATHDLGAEPVTTAVHGTGYWAIWLLVASLVVTPLKTLSGRPNVVVVRRMIGNASLLYALLHLVLYCLDQKWALPTIVSEILHRFYLTIGFIGLAGLLVLGLTSTDGWIWAIGKGWKRLHRAVYLLAALGLFHYVLQSKLDVSQALVAVGVFTWLMLWRLLPTGRDRTWPPLLGLALAATSATVAMEWAWYRFGTRVDPMKVLRGELDVSFGLHPAGQVLTLGLAAVAAFQLWWWSQGKAGDRAWFTVALYALGAFAGDAATSFLGFSPDDADLPPWWQQDAAALGALALLGLARWALRGRWERRLVDAVWLAAMAYEVSVAQSGTTDPGIAVAVLCLGLSLALAQRLWTVSRPAALALTPLGLVLAYGAVALL